MKLCTWCHEPTSWRLNTNCDNCGYRGKYEIRLGVSAPGVAIGALKGVCPNCKCRNLARVLR